MDIKNSVTESKNPPVYQSMYDARKDLEASESLARIVTPVQENYEATTPESPIKVALSVEDGLEVSDGYNINLGDDDDELFIMSK